MRADAERPRQPPVEPPRGEGPAPPAGDTLLGLPAPPPLRVQGTGREPTLTDALPVPDKPRIGAMAAPSGLGSRGASLRGHRRGLHSGFWVGLANGPNRRRKRGRCLLLSLPACLLLAEPLLRARGPRSPWLLQGSAPHPWALAASHPPCPRSWPPFRTAPRCSGHGLSLGGIWLVWSLVGELTLSQIFFEPLWCVGGSLDTRDTAENKAALQTHQA